MASLAFPDISKTTNLANGTTFNYVFVEPANNNPYILFLHGFPSSSYDWRHQISFFKDVGYGVVAPDLLGYGGTDKPLELEAYNLKKMSGELCDLLDYHGIQKVVAVGHDWGSILLSRIAIYHPDRFSAYAFLALGYWLPFCHFDIDKFNEVSKQLLGYNTSGYWYFFISDDGADLMTQYPETSRFLFYPGDPKILKNHLCPMGAARKCYEDQMKGPLSSWMSESEHEVRDQIFSAGNGGYAGGCNWYKAQVANVNAADEEAIPAEKYLIDVPTLFIACDKDYVCVPSAQIDQMKKYVKNLEIETFDSGHWVELEKPKEANESLKKFFDKIG